MAQCAMKHVHLVVHHVTVPAIAPNVFREDMVKRVIKRVSLRVQMVSVKNNQVFAVMILIIRNLMFRKTRLSVRIVWKTVGLVTVRTVVCHVKRVIGVKTVSTPVSDVRLIAIRGVVPAAQSATIVKG